MLELERTPNIIEANFSFSPTKMLKPRDLVTPSSETLQSVRSRIKAQTQFSESQNHPEIFW